MATNNRTIFICKTTALSVWLLQEGERVSTDRLFRVRGKQPYASTIPNIANSGNVKPITICDDEVVSVPGEVPSAVITESKSNCNALKSWLKIGTIALHETDNKLFLMISGCGVPI